MANLNNNKVFISYASEDLATVKKICVGLTQRGLTVWFDKKNKKVGPWKPRILKAITKSRYFVFCLSKAALKKTGDEPGFQDEELNYAYEITMNQGIEQFTIVPVRIEECGRGDHRLSTHQQYDYFNNPEECLNELAVEFGGKSLSNPAARDERTVLEKIILSLHGKSDVAFYAGDYHKDMVLLTTIIEIKPDDDNAWNKKGVTLGRLNRRNEALAAYEQAIKLNPEHDKAWFNKGGCLGRLNRHNEALAAYEQAIKIKPDDAEAWFNKSLALVNLKRYQEALAACEQAIKIKPDYAGARHIKAEVLEFLNLSEEANTTLQKAREINPDFSND